jgi:alpha-glucosidase
LTDRRDGNWWKGSTLYQIYPRSFMDSNGDGVGDLAGITSKLDHVASLGVDGIWLSPFFPSPMADFGYDVSDYCDVDPVFGTLDDFDRLVATAHGLGLKVIIDQVYAHTSDRHDWFAESRASRSNGRANWYVWAEAKADGSPPNNWTSVFGGPGWTWDARRGQYYMHNFLKEQPQLNLHNPSVQDALLAASRFWLDRGVDGFRCDAISFAAHDPALTDNPVAPPGPRTRPWDFQRHLHNMSQPQIASFIRRVRALADCYPASYTLGEVGGEDPIAETKAYTAADEHFCSGYNFAFLDASELTPGLVRAALSHWPDAGAGSWPSWAFSNHDVPRWLSRWAPAGAEEHFARMAMTLFACLPGNLILWQGEELGLTQADVPFDQLRDPEAIANWPLTKGRDGARTPMPWDGDAPHCGFTSGEPWLPIGAGHAARAANVQTRDHASMLNLTRSLIAMRTPGSALRDGGIANLETGGSVLMFERHTDADHCMCLFNFGANPRALSLTASDWAVQHAVNGSDLDMLPPLSALVARRTASG